MKKLLLIPLLMVATMVFADDAVLVENFSKVGKVTSVGNYTWTGDLGTWTVTQGRRNTGDTIIDATLKQGVWLPVSSNGAGKLEVTLTNGIKAVALKYARFGSEKTDGRVLKLKVSVGDTEDNTPEYANNAMTQGTAGHETYSHAFNNKTASAKLTIENVSTYTESLSTTGICRITVADITITPYLQYTTTEATLDLRLGSNKYTNNGLINNTDEGAVVYSISENTIDATIDAATGEVTASKAGEVTVTATWGQISTSYKLTILAKDVATASFAKEAIRVKVNADAPTNQFTTNSNATVAYSSSVPAVAEVDAASGAVTLKGVGTTVITANVPENESYTAASASYTLRVVPANFNLETFTGAHNVDLSTNNTYLTSPTESFAPSEATGLKWTTLLGSVRSALGGSTSSEIAAVVRAKKTSEENFGYILSSKISGGIDSLTFEWNANGSEASRKKNWDIDIYVNDTKVGSINDKGQAVQPAGSWFRFGVGNLKIEGDFTIKFVNNNVPDGTGNEYRFVVDNIEWYSYTAPVYSVAGAEALLGSNWNEKEGNELAKQEDGTYKLVKEAVQLEAGNYEYKVVIDHKWNNGEAGENSVLNIAKAGKYDVIFTYDKNEPKTDAKAGLNAVYSLAGSSALFNGNNWNEKEGFELVKQADRTYKLVVENVELAKGSYEYKVVIDHKWDNGEVSQNSVLNIDKPGKYDITYTYDPFTITTAGEAELKEEIVILPEVDLAGQFNGWKQDDAMTPAEDKLTASISKTLTAGDYTFKVIVATGWRANGQDFTRENNSVTGLTANGDDMTLKADRDGVYVFTWTYESDKLEITFPVADGLQNTGAERMVKKQIIDGQLIITVDGVRYDAQGVVR